MTRVKRNIILAILLTVIANTGYTQLSYSLSNKFWRLKYANIGGREFSFNSGNDNAPTMQISGGSIRGNGGCNAYHTKFTIDGTAMNIGSIMSTRMACNDMYLEEASYFNSLARPQVISYIEGSNELKFINNSGDQLVFFAQFTRSTETYTPPALRGNSTDDQEVRNTPRYSRHYKSAKLSRRELARQRLLEKKMNSKRGKLTKREKRELMALQSKTKRSSEERIVKRKGKKSTYRRGSHRKHKYAHKSHGKVKKKRASHKKSRKRR
jgi:heat shock protein HslJ